MRRFLSVSALLLSLTLAIQAAEHGKGEKVAVGTLPDAVKTTVSKEAPDATEENDVRWRSVFSAT